MNRDRESPYLDDGVESLTQYGARELRWPRDRKGLSSLTQRITYLRNVIKELELGENVVLQTGIRMRVDTFRDYVLSVGTNVIETDREISKVVEFGAELERQISREIMRLFASALDAFSGTASRIEEEGPEIYVANAEEIQRVLKALQITKQLSANSNNLHECVGPYNRAQRLLPMLRAGVKESIRMREVEADNRALLAVLF